ncbi:MAG: hypothetical protein KY466_06285, partial [Gemmatimonadetes bacterium]|nr:hypothetical protein [Gemmatimonadota bacterium]
AVGVGRAGRGVGRRAVWGGAARLPARPQVGGSLRSPGGGLVAAESRRSGAGGLVLVALARARFARGGRLASLAAFTNLCLSARSLADFFMRTAQPAIPASDTPEHLRGMSN